jgi:hypothetical protein
MDKESFKKLFINSVREAIRRARGIVDVQSDSFDIELHGGGVSGTMVAVNEALDRMYINDHSFCRVIDIGVKAFHKNKWVIFARISGHPPASFAETWNAPEGNGPFKVIDPLHIDVQESGFATPLALAPGLKSYHTASERLMVGRDTPLPARPS